MRRIHEIEAEITSLGRPQPEWGKALQPHYRAAHEAAVAEWERDESRRRRYVDLHIELREAEAHWRRAQEAADLERRVLSGLEASGAGERALHAAASPAQTQALEAAQKWLGAKPIDREYAVWLVLLGGTGTGKTVAATWALREALRQGESAYFRTTSRLSRLSGFDEGARELAMLSECGLLVLDDVGAEAQTAWGSGLLQELLDNRHQGYRRTIITSNLSANDFKARLGERMTDRIREDGYVVTLGGKSLRRS